VDLTERAQAISEGNDPAELANAANVEREDVEAFEAGRLAPAGDLLRALSTGLGIEPSALGGYMDPATAVAARFCASCSLPASGSGWGSSASSRYCSASP
jgi:transcriptional regulator with XRE-family HTH domain